MICGPTGVGKSWLACALGHKACRDDRSVLYQRVPRLFADLALARGDGRYARLMRALGGVQLLILDDWGLEPLDADARHDLLEILEDALRPPLHHHHQPAARRRVARADRRPHLRRRHPRPPRPQCPSHRAHRRQPAQDPQDRPALAPGRIAGHQRLTLIAAR